MTQTANPELKPEDLPAWMRPRRWSIDWGLLLMLLFALPIIFPLLSRTGLSRSNDAPLYVFRSQDVADMVRENVFYSRWDARLTYNYGSPVLNFLAPLPHYLAGYHQALTDTDPVSSVRFWFIVSILATGSGMFLFARQRWGAAVGIVAGCIYLYSPPICLTLPYLNGNLALLMALALLPWALWSLDRLRRDPQKSMFILTVLCLAAFMLCDTRITFVGSFIILGVILSGRGLPHTRRYVLGAMLMTLLLTAFFWLPAVFDLDQIRWTPAYFNPLARPIPLTESLSGMPYFVGGVLNPPLYRGIGVGTWVLALIGGAILLLQFAHRHVPFDTLLFAGLGVIFLALSTPGLAGWSHPEKFQPLLPYHLLLGAIFCLSVIGGQAARVLALIGKRGRVVSLSVLAFVPMLASLPVLFPPTWSSVLETASPTAGLTDELQGYHLATLRDGVLLPSIAPQLPDPISGPQVEVQSGIVDRINRQGLTARTRVDLKKQRALYSDYLLNTSEALNIQFYILDYAGWNISLNNQPVKINPSPLGLIGVNLPAGRGDLVLSFDPTPINNAAWLITLGAALLGLIVLRRRWRSSAYAISVVDFVPARQVIGLAIMFAAYGATDLWLNQHPAALAAYPAATATITPLRRFFAEGGIDLLGYNLSAVALAQGDTFDMTIFWQASRPTSSNRQTALAVIRVDTQQTVLQVAHRHPGSIPTLRWPSDQYVRDEFTLPMNLEPGDYQLKILIGNCDQQRIFACDQNQITPPDAYDEFGHPEAGGVTVPQLIRVSAR